MSAQVYEKDRGSGWVTFAAVLMFAVGFARIISSIGYFADSHKINNLANGLFSGHTWGWGLWDLLIAAAAILAGLSLLGGGGYGRVVGYIFGVLIVVQGFTVVGIAPWYGALAIAIGTCVIFGLARSPREAYTRAGEAG
jgi:hypothetical protein